jgi:hypothetical protein
MSTGEVGCIAQPALPEPYLFFDLSVHPCEEAPARAFYSSRSDSYIETRGPTGDPEVVETVYNI